MLFVITIAFKYSVDTLLGSQPRYLFIYFILSFRNHSVITIIWHEMYSLTLNVRRYQQVSLLSRPLYIL